MTFEHHKPNQKFPEYRGMVHELKIRGVASPPSQSEIWLHLLQDPAARQVVIDAVHDLFKRWQLHPINQAALLDITDMSSLDEYTSSSTASSVFIRIGHLLAIDRILINHYPYQAKKRDQWVWQVQSRLRNQTAISLMLQEGLDGIKLIRYLLEIDRLKPGIVYM